MSATAAEDRGEKEDKNNSTLVIFSCSLEVFSRELHLHIYIKKITLNYFKEETKSD